MTCSVGAVLYIGSTIMYQEEADKQHQKKLSKLSAAARTLDIFFVVFQQDLRFLRDLSPFKTYVMSGFLTGPQRENVVRLFKNFLRTHRECHAVDIYDGAGNPVLSVEENSDPYAQEDLKSLASDFEEPSLSDPKLLNENSAWLSAVTMRRTRSETQAPWIPVIGFITISSYRRLVGAQHGIIFSLAALAEGRDPETGEHLERTRQYAILLAGELKKLKVYRKIITADYLEALYTTAPLHDIGKVGIPDAILLKESGLTEEEYEIMKSHVQIANRVIKQTMETHKLDPKVFSVGLNIATFHHEKYNGQGYPEGLKGEEIPLEARIFALCDAYDVIRTVRPYKEEIPHNEAVQRILMDKGEHFDPVIVDAFIRVASQFKAVSETWKPSPG